MKISVIGYGNMGSAIVSSWIANKLVSHADLTIFSRTPARAEKDSLLCFENAEKQEAQLRLQQSDLVLLAIKPQDLASICKEYLIPENAIVISVLAGVSTDKLASSFPAARCFVRTMPNLAARIGKSSTAYFATTNIDQDKLVHVETLISSFGKAYKLESEERLDQWCAVAGSGPGVVFHIMEKFRLAAMELGFDPELSQELVTDIFLACSNLAQQQVNLKADPQHIFSAFVQSVCSKGGTTEQAINILNQAELEKTLTAALQAAASRAKQLNSL